MSKYEVTIRRPPRTWISGVIMLAFLWVMLVAVATMHTYGDITTRNAGVYWNVPDSSHWCGLEYRGHPGFFCDIT